ncbi:MAG TPA: type IV pilus biogenesis/stability protein PilW [Burkholderiaceae bacterium]|nr:type IV pilus biogenesis/stability protein PilW [Burkholderiaceae bacterium]HQR69157.1 type IV pilus biogenesis/stability protein PilW [Burkholderiaceae bacterium]
MDRGQLGRNGARTLAAMAVLGVVVVMAACKTTTVTNSSGEVISTSSTTPAAAQANAKARARARVELAAGYFRNGQVSVALEEARRAAQIDPTSAEAYGLLGLIYTELDDTREAEANFQRALQLDPANPDINNNYGWVLCRGGREQEAMPYFQRALRDPLYATPSLANLNAGMCMMRVRDYGAAEPYLRRAFELDASSSRTKMELTRLYLATGRTDRAAFYYGLLSKSGEDTPESLWLGLKVARAQGDLRTETRIASELRSRFPTSKEAGLLARNAFDD